MGLALNDILNGLGGFGYNDTLNGDGWPRNFAITIFWMASERPAKKRRILWISGWTKIETGAKTMAAQIWIWTLDGRYFWLNDNEPSQKKKHYDPRWKHYNSKRKLVPGKKHYDPRRKLVPRKKNYDPKQKFALPKKHYDLSHFINLFGKTRIIK